MSLQILRRLLSFSLVPLYLAGGCASSSPAGSFSRPNKAVPPKQHEHKAPHGGFLIELGEEFSHVELLIDHDSGRITAYVLDGEAEQSLRIKQSELEIDLEAPVISIKLSAVANVMTGETVGDSSEFSGQSDFLKGLDTFYAVLKKISVRGSDFQDVTFKYP